MQWPAIRCGAFPLSMTRTRLWALFHKAMWPPALASPQGLPNSSQRFQSLQGSHQPPAVCRKSYINPVVFEAWKLGVVEKRVPRTAMSPRQMEKAALILLKAQYWPQNGRASAKERAAINKTLKQRSTPRAPGGEARSSV